MFSYEGFFFQHKTSATYSQYIGERADISVTSNTEYIQQSRLDCSVEYIIESSFISFYDTLVQMKIGLIKVQKVAFNSKSISLNIIAMRHL